MSELVDALVYFSWFVLAAMVTTALGAGFVYWRYRVGQRRHYED